MTHTLSKRYSHIALAAVSGLFYALSFSPYAYAIHLSGILSVAAVALWTYSSIQRACYIEQMTFFYGKWCAIFWLWHPLHHMGHMPKNAAIALTFALVSLMANSSALISYTLIRVTKKNLLKLVIIPFIWIFCEYLSASLFHFPWLVFATTQIHTLWSHVFYYTGTYLGTFLLISAITIMNYGLMQKKKDITLKYCIYTCIILLIMSLIYPPNSESDSQSLSFSVVQGNINKIDYNKRIYNSYIPHMTAKANNDQSLNTYLSLSQWTDQHDLYIWPECVVGDKLEPINNIQMNDIIKEIPTQSTLIFGAFLPGEHDQIASIMVNKRHIQVVHKQHYVPLAEEGYPNWLAHLARRIGLPVTNIQHQGERIKRHFDLTVADRTYQLLPLICYDAAHHVLETNINDVDLIIIQSENIWFASSWADTQQLMIGQYLSMRYAKPLIYSTNSGISAAFTHTGKAVLMTQSNAKLAAAAKIDLQ